MTQQLKSRGQAVGRGLLKDKKVFIGLDIHKRTWSVSIYLESVFQRTYTQPSSVRQLVETIGSAYPQAEIHCVYEAGCFGYWIQRKLAQAGWHCIVVNPADIPQTNKQQTEKTDSVDSKKLASCLQSGLLRGIHIPWEELESDRHLLRTRKRIWSDMVRVKNRIKSMLCFTGIELPPEFDNANWSKAFINWIRALDVLPSTRISIGTQLDQLAYLHKQTLELNKEIRKMMQQSQYKNQYKLLQSIPGIGPLTSSWIITELGSVDRFKCFEHFNSWIGLKPMSHSSGERDIRSHLTYRSKEPLRSLLIEASWISIQKDPGLALYYDQQKKKRGAKRAIICVARKLARRIYHVLKTKEIYEIGLA